MLKKFAALALLMSLPALSAGNSQAAEKGNEMKAVNEIASRFVDAWNKHDMAALAGLFAEDAHFVNVVGTWWKNREEIRKAHEFSHRTMFKESRLSGEAASTRFIRPDVAVMHMKWELEGMKSPAGKPVPRRQGILMFVASRESGEWRIQAAQNTDIIPEAQPK